MGAKGRSLKKKTLIDSENRWHRKPVKRTYRWWVPDKLEKIDFYKLSHREAFMGNYADECL